MKHSIQDERPRHRGCGHHRRRARGVLDARARHRWRRRRLRAAHRDQPAAPVAAAGAVRRLLRRAGPGLLRGGGLHRRRRSSRRAATSFRRTRSSRVTSTSRSRGFRRCSAPSRPPAPSSPTSRRCSRSPAPCRCRSRATASQSVADFEGKRIGSWGFGNEWEIFAAMAADGLDSTSVSITTQDFSMNALLDGDVDAAQAMTYNEWAQILEVVNPATGELYQPGGLRRRLVRGHRRRHVQDAIWADTARLADDPAYADAAVRFLKAIIKGWVFARDNPEEAAAIVYDAAINAEAAFPVGPVHQLWQMNEVNKLIWAGGKFGVIDQASLGQDGRGRARGGQPGRPQPDHGRAGRIGVLERVHRAGARRARGGRRRSSTASTRRSTSCSPRAGSSSSPMTNGWPEAPGHPFAVSVS